MSSLLPRMQLDQLLEELQTRLQAVLAARDGMHALLDAVVSIGRELELETVLRRIVEAAMSLVDCRYGALGVIGEDGHLAQFVPVGLSEAQIADIAEWPHGRGILGLLIKEPRGLRLEEISEAPESYGFPEGHPPMHTFLGVPVRIRDVVFGNLYLTEKNGGRQFDEQDEMIVTALATAAGIAIENARLYEDTRRRERWLDASGEITRELLSGLSSADTLRLVAARAREMSDAAVAAVVVPDAGGFAMSVAAVDGDDDLHGLSIPVEGTLAGSVLASGDSITVTSVADADHAPLASRLPGGPAILLPLGVPERVRAVLVVGKAAGATPFAATTMRMLQQFADQAGLVLELADARRRTEQSGLVDDRSRIARDLHDVVIQRLFASAMTLTGVIRLVDQPDVARRVESTVDDLDLTIRQIRSTIFALQTREGDDDGDSLRSRVVAISRNAGRQLGFAPSVSFEGTLDTDVSAPLADEVVAVVQEGLANVVRHAQASRADVLVRLDGDVLAVRIADNGVGVGSTDRRSGLANLAERAARLGGRFEIGAADTGGTVLAWTVPV
ncbi:MAG TPA: GAF domain-containing protein [Jiangellaceae bacterium]